MAESGTRGRLARGAFGALAAAALGLFSALFPGLSQAAPPITGGAGTPIPAASAPAPAYAAPDSAADDSLAGPRSEAHPGTGAETGVSAPAAAASTPGAAAADSLVDTAAAASPAAVSAPPRRFPGQPLLLQAPLVDWPSGFEEANGGGGFLSPSMRQSLLWTASATQLGVQTLAWAWEPEKGGFWRDWGFWLSMGAFTFFTTYLPLGDAWTHEEWHRAVLTRGGAESHNGVYGAEVGAEIIKVDGVADADLARLKDESPADFVRLMEAGLEGEVEVRRLMRRNNFFLGRPSRHDRFVWWVQGLNSAYYLAACANGWLDEDIRDMEAGETGMDDRDFTGPDFTAWVYDLRRPDEPYADGPRGRPHPSGTPGYRRYLASSDLTGAERDYLRLQAWLSLLNFASPQYWGPDWLPWELPGSGRGVLWNAGLVHHLTPFGYSLGGDLFLKRGKWAWVLGLQGYVNSDWVLPGISGQIFRYPLQIGRQVVCLTGEASAWLQPEDLRFDAAGALPGGSLLAGLALPFAGGIELWAEADAKSEGWVPGNVYLDPAVQARAGLALRL